MAAWQAAALICSKSLFSSDLSWSLGATPHHFLSVVITLIVTVVILLSPVLLDVSKIPEVAKNVVASPVVTALFRGSVVAGNIFLSNEESWRLIIPVWSKVVILVIKCTPFQDIKVSRPKDAVVLFQWVERVLRDWVSVHILKHTCREQ